MSKYIITGNLSSPQNITSISRWLKEYAMILREIDSEMELTIAGKNPDASIISAASAVGALIIPSPKDMFDLLDGSDVYICPSDNGGGIKLRLMDGLKHGLPVVSHFLASRGYEPFIGKSLFLYEDALSFKDAVYAARGKCRERKAGFIKWIDKIMEVEKKIERYKTLLADWVKLANSQIELVDNVDYSIVLKCRFIEQMSYEDIGDKIYVSLATVKRWLRYAINDFGRINNYKIES